MVDDDPADAGLYYADAGADGFGDAATEVSGCEPAEGWVDDATDCDDTLAEANPAADEQCDEVDNDCDGEVDEDDATDVSTWYADADADGYGDEASSVARCAAPDGYVAIGTDCDDAEAAIHPDAAETDCADPVDYNCDGSVGYDDVDRDGAPACEDCDDTDAGRSPGLSEVCDAADLDEDCDSLADDADDDATGTATWYRDVDGDAYGDSAGAMLTQCDAPAGYAAVAADCDDYDSGVNPGATEVCDAADTDEDCDGAADDADSSVDASTWGTWYADDDGDGHGDASRAVTLCDVVAGYIADATDCDDGDAARSPSQAEVCDAADLDEDCDALADDADPSVSDGTTWYVDSDGDGYGDAGTPVTSCSVPTGYVADATDCDDTQAARNPGATEVCDAADVDEDCDGLADDADASTTGEPTWYRDADGDGYAGAASVTRTSCAQPAGYTSTTGDCDDLDGTVNPGAVEICDALDADEDCDGGADDADGDVDPATWSTFYRDYDGDTYGDAARSVDQCDAPASYVDDANDCDDTASAVSPAGTEVCDAVDADEDCDGRADDADTSVTGGTVYYRDADADAYGAAGSTRTACALPAGYVANATDCNDADATISPADAEICDAANTDEDCDGTADDLDADVTSVPTWYRDADGDTYGAAASTYRACEGPSGYVALSTDCDDTEAGINPAATEVCDADDTDEDCDGLADDRDSVASGESAWYGDRDGDGYGAGTATLACDQPTGYASNAADCDDGAASTHPGASENCATTTDDDCSGSTNDEDATGCSDWYADADGDGYGAGAGACFCVATSPYDAAVATDCDDGASTVSPGATETCATAADDDCDGSSNDPGATGCTTWYADTDADGYGGTPSQCTCSAEGAYTASGSSDCDDTETDVNPGEVEECDNGVDDDCDGTDDTCPQEVVAVSTADVVYTGEAAADTAGVTAWGRGDIDADGYDDILLGAYGNDDGVSNGGSAYVVYGGTSLTSGSLSGADLQFTGAASSDYAGTSVAWVGDVDADGYDDALVGAPYYGASNDGAVALLLGGPGLTSHSIATADAIYTGQPADEQAGNKVAGAGDVNADGFDDMLVGAFGSDATATDSGTAYLVLGSAAPASAGLGTKIEYAGENADDWAGFAVSGAGDVDGDGFDDLLVGAYRNEDTVSYAGAAYLVLGGSALASTNLSGADVRYTGRANDVAGYSVACAGDTDADGYADMLIAAYGNSDAAAYAGAAYLVLGSASPGSMSLAGADAEFTGETAYDRAGSNLAAAGDLDADGFDDFLVGAAGNDDAGSEYGAWYLVWGAATPASESLALAPAQYTGGGSSDWFGVPNSGPAGNGDVDGDGVPDLLFGGVHNDLAGTSAGAAWLYYGGGL